MKKSSKILTLCIAVFMVMQVILPTISQAVDAVKLNIQYERPYADDDGDGTEGNDKYTLLRGDDVEKTTQTVFKIGEQIGLDENGKPILNHNRAYYCLRGGLGFGSTTEILESGVDYTKLADLSSKEAVMNYFKDTIGYDIPEANYNAICWIADNMYLPKSEYAEDLKANLLKNAGITSSLLTDDDIEVVQQIALWYFANYDENGEANSVSLADTVDLANLLQINNTQPNNDTTVAYNKNRATQINTLYRYFIDKAKEQSEEGIIETTLYGDINCDGKIDNNDVLALNWFILYPADYPLTEKGTKQADVNLDGEINNEDADIIAYYIDKKNGVETLPYIPDILEKNLETTIEEKIIPGTSINAYVVGPFKINKIPYEDYKFSYALKYKTSNIQEDWSILEIDNITGTIYLSNEEGVALDRTKNVEDMIAGDNFYITILKDILDISNITEFCLDISYSLNYYNTTAEVLVANVDDQPVLKVEKTKISVDPTDSIIVKKDEEPEKVFDLALRKFITATNGEEITSRIPKINLADLRNGTDTEVEFVHTKDAIHLKRGATIVYTIRVYNQGELDGFAKEVTDYLCDGLELVKNSEINKQYGWAEDGKTLTTNYLANTLIKAYDKNVTSETIERDELWQKAEDGTDGLYYADLQVECRINDIAKVNTVLPNIAAITEDLSYGEKDEADVDSEPSDLTESEIRDYSGSIEDDDDYERVIIDPEKVFDLALRKYISNIERNGESLELESRIPQIDTTSLKDNGPTANYVQPKNILTVKQGDIITYKLRVYNEGELDGYASEITDYIPEGLGLLLGYSGNDSWSLKSSVNSQPLVGENGIYKTEKDVPTNGIFEDEDVSKIEVVTGKDDLLKIVDAISLTKEEKLIKKYGSEVVEGDLYQQSIKPEDDGLFYQEIEVTCIVLAPNTYEGNIVNIAEISKDKAVDEAGKEIQVPDRDSNPDNVDLNNYELREENSTYQQDDDDYEAVQLKYFDLALRKFITGVNDKDVNTRVPEFTINEDGDYVYNHDKTPVEVADNDEVTYTIRVYNEGTVAGFAEKIEDDIPEGLVFLSENETNKEYGWKMYYYDEEGTLVETEEVEQAEVIRTTYLSEAEGNVNEETGKNSNLLEVFNKETMESPDYRDVKVVFEVSQEKVPEENEDGIIVNKAHITEDSDDDEDSIPDKWNDGEDDQDKEYIYVQKFDLALFKWVSQTIVTVDGKTTTTETGFKPNVGKTEEAGDNYRENSEEEPIASVSINKKKLNSTVVKFVYNIKVVNEGDIEGYATEITDYIPEGLKFIQEDNKLWNLTEEGKITTRALETTLLEPGESAEVPVIFTWINNANNLGLKTNIAEITEDYNEKGVKDEDSVPGNADIPNYDKEQEDDDDFALVILTLSTGKQITYIWLVFVIITVISSGTILIKKYVL